MFLPPHLQHFGRGLRMLGFCVPIMKSHIDNDARYLLTTVQVEQTINCTYSCILGISCNFSLFIYSHPHIFHFKFLTTKCQVLKIYFTALNKYFPFSFSEIKREFPILLYFAIFKDSLIISLLII